MTAQLPPGFCLLHASAHLLVVDKPAGLLTVPGRGPDKADCLWRRVQAAYPDALIVHRLDMATSGIVVLARGAASQRALSILFQERQVEKRYQALVSGVWTHEPVGSIDLPLIADWPNRPRQKVDFAVGRPSLTHYRWLENDTLRQRARLELRPVTGRSHQLRVHLQALGHPILGDDLYGAAPTGEAGARLMLHATRIAFADPLSDARIDVASPVPF